MTYLRAATLATLMIGLASCTVPLSGRLLNATTGDVVIDVSDARGKAVGHFEVASGAAVEIENWERVTLVVSSAGERHRYDVARVDLDYVRTEGYGPLLKRVVTIALQADGAMYLLSAERTSSAATSPSQPAGYPLRPARE